MDALSQRILDGSANSFMKRNDAIDLVRRFEPVLWQNQRFKSAMIIVSVGATVFAVSLMWPVVTVVAMEALKSMNWVDFSNLNPDSYRLASIIISTTYGCFASMLTRFYLRRADHQILHWKDRTLWLLKNWSAKKTYLTEYQLESILKEAPESFCNEINRKLEDEMSENKRDSISENK